MEETENQVEDINEAEESTAPEEMKSQKLLERAFRWPRLGVAERLVCQHLFLASNTTQATQIVDHAYSAVMVVEGLNTNVENLDFEMMKKIYLVNQCLKDTIRQRISQYQWMRILDWSFPWTEENVEKYLIPWTDGVGIRFYKEMLYYGGRLRNLNFEELPEWHSFLLQCTCLTESSYKKLVDAFLGWATVHCQHAIAVLSSLVSPRTLEEVTKLMTRGGEEKEQEGEKGNADLLET